MVWFSFLSLSIIGLPIRSWCKSLCFLDLTHMWHMTCDMCNVTCVMWQVICDMWHVTCLWVWTFSKNFSCSSYSLWFLIFGRFGGKGSLTESINEWISDKGFCRTAPATPDLLNMYTTFSLSPEVCFEIKFGKKN